MSKISKQKKTTSKKPLKLESFQENLNVKKEDDEIKEKVETNYESYFNKIKEISETRYFKFNGVDILISDAERLKMVINIIKELKEQLLGDLK